MLFSHDIDSWTTGHACHLCTTLPEWVRITDLLCSLHSKDSQQSPSSLLKESMSKPGKKKNQTEQNKQTKQKCQQKRANHTKISDMFSTIPTPLIMAGVEKAVEKVGEVLSAHCLAGRTLFLHIFLGWHFKCDALSGICLTLFQISASKPVTFLIQWRETGMSEVWIIWFTLHISFRLRWLTHNKCLFFSIEYEGIRMNTQIQIATFGQMTDPTPSGTGFR